MIPLVERGAGLQIGSFLREETEVLNNNALDNTTTNKIRKTSRLVLMGVSTILGIAGVGITGALVWVILKSADGGGGSLLDGTPTNMGLDLTVPIEPYIQEARRSCAAIVRNTEKCAEEFWFLIRDCSEYYKCGSELVYLPQRFQNKSITLVSTQYKNIDDLSFAFNLLFKNREQLGVANAANTKSLASLQSRWFLGGVVINGVVRLISLLSLVGVFRLSTAKKNEVGPVVNEAVQEDLLNNRDPDNTTTNKIRKIAIKIAVISRIASVGIACALAWGIFNTIAEAGGLGENLIDREEPDLLENYLRDRCIEPISSMYQCLNSMNNIWPKVCPSGTFNSEKAQCDWIKDIELQKTINISLSTNTSGSLDDLVLAGEVLVENIKQLGVANALTTKALAFLKSKWVVGGLVINEACAIISSGAALIAYGYSTVKRVRSR